MVTARTISRTSLGWTMQLQEASTPPSTPTFDLGLRQRGGTQTIYRHCDTDARGKEQPMQYSTQHPVFSPGLRQREGTGVSWAHLLLKTPVTTKTKACNGHMPHEPSKLMRGNTTPFKFTKALPVLAWRSWPAYKEQLAQQSR